MTKLRNKEEYEAPITTKRVVQMEGSACVVASGERIEKEGVMKITAGKQEDAGFDIRFDNDVDWAQGY